MRPGFRDKRNWVRRLWDSSKYSMQGFHYAYKYESSFTIHFAFFIVSLIVAYFLKITMSQWFVIIGFNLLIILVELINTAVEAVVDLVTKEKHSLAKIAKDCASAASFVIASTTVIAEIIIFMPYIQQIIGR